MLRDRGTIKWTSLMLPEHVELLKEMWQEDTKVQKPEMDAQEMEIMNLQLNRAYYYKESIQLSIYTNGEITTFTGNIKQINKYTKTIQLEYDQTDRTIAFSEIVGISIL